MFFESTIKGKRNERYNPPKGICRQNTHCSYTVVINLLLVVFGQVPALPDIRRWDQGQQGQLADWCVEGWKLRFNKVHCQWIICLCHRDTLNTIALLTLRSTANTRAYMKLTCTATCMQDNARTGLWHTYVHIALRSDTHIAQTQGMELHTHTHVNINIAQQWGIHHIIGLEGILISPMSPLHHHPLMVN